MIAVLEMEVPARLHQLYGVADIRGGRSLHRTHHSRHAYGVVLQLWNRRSLLCLVQLLAFPPEVIQCWPTVFAHNIFANC